MIRKVTSPISCLHDSADISTIMRDERRTSESAGNRGGSRRVLTTSSIFDRRFFSRNDRVEIVQSLRNTAVDGGAISLHDLTLIKNRPGGASLMATENPFCSRSPSIPLYFLRKTSMADGGGEVRKRTALHVSLRESSRKFLLRDRSLFSA